MEYGNFKKREGGGYRDRNDRDRGGYREGGGYRDRNDRGGYRGGGGGGFRDNRGGAYRDRNDRGGYREGGSDRFEQEESVFSKRVRAGKRRTYFFDVRKTRGEDYFITITESTRREDGYGYKRHKLFLYKEDFNRFLASLTEVVNHVKTDLMPEFDYEEFDRRQAEWEAQNRDMEEDDDHDDHREARDGSDREDDFDEDEDGNRSRRSSRKDDDEVSW